MVRNGATRTKRIDLSNGNWAEVRTKLTVGDVKHQQMEAHSRGFQNETLDSLSLIGRLVEKWSYGEVTSEKVDELEVADALKIVSAINEVMTADPNLSSPSSDGTDEGAEQTQAGLPASG